MNLDLWQEWFTYYFDETKGRQPEFDPEDYYRSGRASKANPNKEDPAWWAENGPRFVDLWASWRDASGLQFAEFPDQDGVLYPAIELETWAENGDLMVKSIIDRVMTDGTDLYIVDLKTGSMTPPWPLQLALNNLGLMQTVGEKARWAGFWSARKGGVEKWHDLSIYPDEWLWDQVAKAKAIRDQQLFLANPNNLCVNACGVKQFCVAMGGTPPFFPTDATLTQVQRKAED